MSFPKHLTQGNGIAPVFIFSDGHGNTCPGMDDVKNISCFASTEVVNLFSHVKDTKVEF